MDWLEMLNKIFEVCIVPLLGVLTAYLVQYIQVKQKEIAQNTNNELVKKYTEMAEQTITDCVIATNQIYVNALKDKNAFDLDQQKAAFELTYKAVLNLLTDEAQKYLTEAYGDLTEWVKQKIEAEVSKNKK